MYLTLTVSLLLATDPIKPPSEGDSKPKPSPFAPSLPELTDEQEKKLDAIIDRFIEADTGKLTGSEAKKAFEDFKNLGPEAFFALVRGLNKSANIDHSCPAVTIARKLNSQLIRSEDTELLQYARENIGVGVKTSKHLGVLRDLKMNATTRQNSVKNQPRPNLIGGPGK